MLVRPAHGHLNKERNNMNTERIIRFNSKNSTIEAINNKLEINADGVYTKKLFAAVREQMARVPYLNNPKCYKTFILTLILNSGLEYDYVMSYLDSLNAYDENDKGWKKIDLNMSIEERFDILGWEKVVKKLIVWATSDSYSLAA